MSTTRTATDGPRGAAAAVFSKRIAFVQATWHRDIVDQARRSFLDGLAELKVPAEVVDVFEVPGVFEIPLHAKLLAESGQYDAIVAAGFIVDGGIYRHEFVSTAVIDGLMRVQLDTRVPVFSVVLTPQRFHEHEDHRRFFVEHFLLKGREAAVALVRTQESLSRLRR